MCSPIYFSLPVMTFIDLSCTTRGTLDLCCFFASSFTPTDLSSVARCLLDSRAANTDWLVTLQTRPPFYHLSSLFNTLNEKRFVVIFKRLLTSFGFTNGVNAIQLREEGLPCIGHEHFLFALCLMANFSPSEKILFCRQALCVKLDSCYQLPCSCLIKVEVYGWRRNGSHLGHCMFSEPHLDDTTALLTFVLSSGQSVPLFRPQTPRGVLLQYIIGSKDHSGMLAQFLLYQGLLPQITTPTTTTTPTYPSSQELEALYKTVSSGEALDRLLLQTEDDKNVQRGTGLGYKVEYVG